MSAFSSAFGDVFPGAWGSELGLPGDVRRGLEVLRGLGSRAYVWLPGNVPFYGIRRENFTDSAGTIPAVVGDYVGNAVSSYGQSGGAAIQTSTPAKPILRQDSNGAFCWEMGTGRFLITPPLAGPNDDVLVISAQKITDISVTNIYGVVEVDTTTLQYNHMLISLAGGSLRTYSYRSPPSEFSSATIGTITNNEFFIASEKRAGENVTTRKNLVSGAGYTRIFSSNTRSAKGYIGKGLSSEYTNGWIYGRITVTGTVETEDHLSLIRLMQYIARMV